MMLCEASNLSFMIVVVTRATIIPIPMASKGTFSISNVTQWDENTLTDPLSPQACARHPQIPPRTNILLTFKPGRNSSVTSVVPQKVISGSGSGPASIHPRNLRSLHGVGYQVHVLQAACTISL